MIRITLILTLPKEVWISQMTAGRAYFDMCKQRANESNGHGTPIELWNNQANFVMQGHNAILTALQEGGYL